MALNTLDAVDEARVEALLAKMSLDDKLGQMFQVDWRIFRARHRALSVGGWLGRVLAMAIDALPGMSNDKALTDGDAHEVRRLALGSVLGGGGAFPTPNTAEQWCAQMDALQRAAAATASAVPLLIGNDTVHGQVNLKGATIFPHHIALGCTRDPDLVERLAVLAARESAACGINWIFAPCATVPQDLRWGRTYEGFSEDPTLVGELSAAEVRGLQGAGVPMAACAKHWVADGGTALGTGTADFGWTGAPPRVLDQGDAQCDEAELRGTHVPPYVPALAAGCLTVMASYSSLRGAKVHASRALLTELLKGELGFRGLVVSDYNAVQQCAPSYREAVAACINAGVDMVMTAGGLWGDVTLRQQLQAAAEAARAGDISPERIDDAVRRILRVKAALGLLGAPPPLSADARRALWPSVGGAEHRATAREAVARSLVLLRSARGALPLRRDGALLVCGRGAHDLGMQCGGMFEPPWSCWRGPSLPAPPVATAASGGAPQEPRRASAPRRVLSAAVAPPPKPGEVADFPGHSARRCGGWTMEWQGCAGNTFTTGTTIWEAADALVAAWLPGTEGDGVADVLFGAQPPRGTLSFSWPRDASQFRHGWQRFRRAERQRDPLFPLGFGLGVDGERLRHG